MTFCWLSSSQGEKNTQRNQEQIQLHAFSALQDDVCNSLIEVASPLIKGLFVFLDACNDDITDP